MAFEAPRNLRNSGNFPLRWQITRRRNAAPGTGANGRSHRRRRRRNGPPRSRRPRCPATSRARRSPAARCSPAARWRPAGSPAAAIVLPGDRLRARPGVRGAGVPVAGRRPAERLHRRQLHAGHDLARRRRRRRGGQDDSSTCARRNPRSPGRIARRVHRDLDPLRAPRVPGALGHAVAAVRLSLPRRRLRLESARSSAARRCGRSTVSRRASRTARCRSARATASTPT